MLDYHISGTGYGDSYMAGTPNWHKVKKTDGPIGLFEALGIKKGTISFPKLQTQIPQQISAAGGTSQGSGGGQPSGGGGPGNESSNKALAQSMAAAVGWTGDQWTALNNIIMAESGYDVTAENPSGAYGIPQALPGSKMASAGSDWRSSARTQIKWMLGYIRSTYGNPVNAWQFHLAHGWY